jgi:tetrahydromethanopterin S-methyltransferase subunit A
VIEGATPAALYATAIERGLLTRLDHAAYLGRELGRAEQSLRTAEHYVQDRAAGIEEGVILPAAACGCGPGEVCR